MSKVLNVLFILLFTLCLFGCFSNNKTSPSYVIVAIDRFGAGSVSCPEYLERGEGGFFILCNDFVKLTNAYTTSLQAPAAIASLLTGEYPINHGLRHADNFLDLDTLNLAQVLIDKHYKTAFFSEGDPIKTYQGLHRGFQNFYDFSMALETQSLTEVFKAARDFIIKSKKPTLSVVYISSLKKMIDDKNIEDQLEDELKNFFTELKKKQKWHNTNIVVVGLQGQMDKVSNNVWPMVDLSEKNIKIEAFIKPSTKPRDREISFQLDENVSLADIGLTLLDWAGKKIDVKDPNQSYPEITTSKSLTPYFSGKDGKSIKSSPMLIESSWPDWRYGSAPVYLILDDQYRVFLDKHIKIFNTVMSREVGLNLEAEEQLPDRRKYFYLSMASKLNSDGKDQFKKTDISKFSLGFQIWGLKNYKYPEILTDIEEIIDKDEDNRKELTEWMAKLAVIHQDCETLQKLAKKNDNKKWLVAANSCLDVNTKFSNAFRTGCLRVFFKEVKTWSNQCQNDLLYHAWKLVRFDQSEAQAKNFKTFYQQNAVKDYKIQSNWKTYLSSSLIHEISMEPTDFELYYLQLSQSQKNLIDQAKLP